jgi:hypothetical protein
LKKTFPHLLSDEEEGGGWWYSPYCPLNWSISWTPLLSLFNFNWTFSEAIRRWAASSLVNSVTATGLQSAPIIGLRPTIPTCRQAAGRLAPTVGIGVWTWICLHYTRTQKQVQGRFDGNWRSGRATLTVSHPKKISNIKLCISCQTLTPLLIIWMSSLGFVAAHCSIRRNVLNVKTNSVTTKMKEVHFSRNVGTFAAIRCKLEWRPQSEDCMCYEMTCDS